MGLLSKVKKFGKKVVGGVTKVFKSVMKPIGKLMQKDWFKKVMLAATIVTGGVALASGITAGLGASAQGAGFLQSFVTGGKAFAAALANPMQAGKDLLGKAGMTIGQGAATAGQAVQAGQSSAGAGFLDAAGQATGLPSAGGVAEAATGAVAEGLKGGLAAGNAYATAPAGGLQGLATQAGIQTGEQAAGGGLLSKALKGAWDFAKSPGGAQIIGNTITGAFAPSEADDAIKVMKAKRKIENEDYANYDWSGVADRRLTLPTEWGRQNRPQFGWGEDWPGAGGPSNTYVSQFAR